MNISSTPSTSSLNLVSTKDAEGTKDETDKAGTKCSIVALDHCYARLSQELTDTPTTTEEMPVLERVATSYVTPEPPAKKISICPQNFSLTGKSLSSWSSITACQLDQVVQVACVVEVETAVRSKKSGDKKARSPEKRRLENKEAARRTRQKVQTRFAYLQEEVENLKMENLYLQVKNTEMAEHISNTEAENKILRGVLPGERFVPVAATYKLDSNKMGDLEDEDECAKQIPPKKEFESVPDYFELDDQAIFDSDDDAS
ncbi:bZIP transcription factor [Endozoicomonas sp. 8E]|uniref:bZIP transcription factor n=1 Tax=Endozoicomonas sp. 8E TaxID=3035692 RepID=UPI0029390ED1|nr:bZIP transcription factor [Endozoicomonas sp. 8E]WOG25745.1 bZIP transcription factor [Endozoicomonas sp. 8E]